MTIDLWMAVGACVMPYLVHGIVVGLRLRPGAGPFDNHHPRDAVAATSGIVRRAYAAELNAFESALPFVTIVLISHMVLAEHGSTAMLGAGWFVFRFMHVGCYLANWAIPRSVSFGGANLCLVGMLTQLVLAA